MGVDRQTCRCQDQLKSGCPYRVAGRAHRTRARPGSRNAGGRRDLRAAKALPIQARDQTRGIDAGNGRKIAFGQAEPPQIVDLIE